MKATKLIGMLAVLAMTSTAAAADDGFKISGDFAASYFGESGNGANGGVGTGPNIGAAHDTFSLDMTEIDIAKTMGNSGIMLGIGYGSVFNSFDGVGDGTSTATTTIIKPTLNLTNTYFWHKIGDTGLTVKLGKMTTGIGYETYNYMDNMNYTRSYGFQLRPVFATGVSLMYSQAMWDVSVATYNSIRNTDFDENGNKMIQVSAGVKPIENLAINASWLGGKDGNNNRIAIGDYNSKYSLIDVNASYKWTMWNFALDYTTVSTDPENPPSPLLQKITNSSIAAYAGMSMDNWGAGLRFESAKHDPDGTVVPATPGTNLYNNNFPLPSGLSSETITAFTLSGYYDIDTNARLKLDIGQQKGETNSFVDHDGKPKDNMMFYGLGMMYRF